jgi:hypothetical protein
MKTTLVPRIQHSITEKRQNLEQWLEESPKVEVETCLGCATEQDVHAHLDFIGIAMQKTETDEFGVCTVCRGRVGSNLLEVDYTASI